MAVDKFQLTVEAMTRGEGDLKRLEDAVNRFSMAADRAGKGSTAMSSSLQVSGQKIKDALANPLGAAQSALDGITGKLGVFGSAASAAATVAVATSVGIFKLASAFGDLYEQQSNNATRLGVSIRDYGLLDRVAKEAGLSGESLVGTMRGLSKALADTGEEGTAASRALGRLGVSGTDSFGAVRPMKDLLLDIADRLGQIQNPAERAELAMKTLGRAGLEVLPLMNSDLRQQIELLEQSGAGWTEASQRLGAAADLMSDKFDRWWASTIKATKATAAAFALAATNPGEWAKYNAELNRGAFGVTLGTVGNFPQMATGGPGFFPNMTDEQLAAVRRNQARSEIQSFLGSDAKGLLTQKQSDLKRVIDEASGPEDVARVRALTAEIRNLEASIKAAEEAAKRSEKLKQYTAGVFQYGLMTPARPSATGFNLANPGQKFVGGPSLLRAGESVNRGTLGSDPAQFQAQQERSLAALRSQVEYQSRLVELIAGPGGELSAIQQSTALRLSALEREKELGASIFEIERQRQQIIQGGQLRILELQRQRLDEAKQTGGSIFDALLAGGAGVKGFASSFGLGIGRTVFGNAYGQFATGLAGRFSATNDPNSLAGKLLAGTPFGADKSQQAGMVQLSAGQLQLQAGAKMMAAASMMGGGGFSFGGASGIGSILDSLPLGGNGVTARTIGWLAPQGMSTNSGGSAARTMGLIGAGVGAGFGVYSGIRQGGAGGALTALGSAAGGAAAILPAISQTLSLAGPIGGAIAVGAALAMAFLPDPKAARQKALEEQARQRVYDEATGTEYVSTTTGRSVDYAKSGGVRVYLSVNALDSQSIIDRQADIGEAVRQALSSYPPLATDIKGAALGA